jgi:hypothetical protein
MIFEQPFKRFALTLLAALGFLGAAHHLTAATVTNPAVSRSSALTNSIPMVPRAEIPTSVFEVPGKPQDGRNPFFPTSRPSLPATPGGVKPAGPDMSAFVLNGTTSGSKRTAMINARTFEMGEEGEVRLPSGAKAMVKCEEIRPDSAVIRVNGVRRELKLRAGF